MNGNQNCDESKVDAPLNPPKPKIVRRHQWGAKRPSYQSMIFLPTPAVMLTYFSDTEPCTTSKQCKQTLRDLQRRHKDKNRFADIAYNFLIGGNGTIYKGRGWLFNAERPKDEYKKWSGKCIEIAFIGDYRHQELPSVMDKAVKKLIAYGISKDYIQENYQLVKRKDFPPCADTTN